MRTHDTEDGTNWAKPTAEGIEPTEGDALSAVERTETIADCVDPDRIDSELPDAWTVRPDLVQSEAETLAETLLFRRSIAEPQLALKPADPTRPREDIELYERRGPHSTSRRTMTVDRLEEAVRVAINRIHQLDG